MDVDPDAAGRLVEAVEGIAAQRIEDLVRVIARADLRSQQLERCARLCDLHCRQRWRALLLAPVERGQGRQQAQEPRREVVERRTEEHGASIARALERHLPGERLNQRVKRGPQLVGSGVPIAAELAAHEAGVRRCQRVRVEAEPFGDACAKAEQQYIRAPKQFAERPATVLDAQIHGQRALAAVNAKAGQTP